MAELGSMVASITHEISSPLSNLSLALDCMIDDSVKLNTEVDGEHLSKQRLSDYLSQTQESLQMCHANAKRASELMTSFKKVAVYQCNNKCLNFNLKQNIDDILLTLRPKLANCCHQFTVDIDETIQLTSCPGALSQVIINLVNNSLLHGFKEEQQGLINISAKPIKNGVVLCYQDNGIGMNEQQQQKAFTKYFTTKEGKGGSGLGLSICRELVENELAGSIVLTSAVGNGVTFTITITEKNPTIEASESA